jgi:pimeloyl-ACP methyl ester carboxylesterase
VLISCQIHGFTGSSAVWKKNIPALAKRYRVIAPDLRGHGESDKPKHGFHVSRLAMDLRELIQHLQVPNLKALGGSLGCSILWCYAELFTTLEFSHMIFVDQSPLQNSTLDGWDSRYCNRGMNSAPAVAALQTTLALAPQMAHRSTIAACLAYRSHPDSSDTINLKTQQEDEDFFLGEAMKGDGQWYGKLMEDHTALDWRESIKATFGPSSGSKTKVLVVASSRSGCFPSEGPIQVVGFVNGDASNKLATGLVTQSGGHWCYWEMPDEFNELVIHFLDD